MFVATCITPLNFDMSTMRDGGLDAGSGKRGQGVVQDFIPHGQNPDRSVLAAASRAASLALISSRINCQHEWQQRASASVSHATVPSRRINLSSGSSLSSLSQR
jgi:hypothetical protein